MRTKLRLVCFVVFSPCLPEKGSNLFSFLSSLNESGKKPGSMNVERRLFPTDVVRPGIVKP